MVEARKVGINVILVLLFVVALIGLFFLVNLGLPSGTSYLFLSFLGVVFILIVVVAKFVFKRKFWFELPISVNAERGVLMLFLGMLLLGGLVFVSSITGAEFYSPFAIAPLGFKGQISIGVEAFQALSAATSPIGRFFIIVVTASVVEEIILGFAFMAMGSFIFGLGFRKLFNIDIGDTGNDTIDFIGALIFSVSLFTILHMFNGTYVSPEGIINYSAFAFAAGFRFVLNVLIYKFGNFGLLFSIGVHAVNNALFLGGAIVLAALISPVGVLFAGFIIVIIYFAITSIPKIIEEGTLVAKDFPTFD